MTTKSDKKLLKKLIHKDIFSIDTIKPSCRLRKIEYQVLENGAYDRSFESKTEAKRYIKHRKYSLY